MMELERYTSFNLQNQSSKATKKVILYIFNIKQVFVNKLKSEQKFKKKMFFFKISFLKSGIFFNISKLFKIPSKVRKRF